MGKLEQTLGRSGGLVTKKLKRRTRQSTSDRLRSFRGVWEGEKRWLMNVKWKEKRTFHPNRRSFYPWRGTRIGAQLYSNNPRRASRSRKARRCHLAFSGMGVGSELGVEEEK